MTRRAAAGLLVLLLAGCRERPGCESDCDCYGAADDECPGEWRCVVDECFFECRPACTVGGACEEPDAHCSPETRLCSLRTECTEGLGGGGG